MATKSIGATGRDYSTIALWAAYVNALTLSAAELGEMYNDAEFTASANITIGGWTGGSGTNTVTLKCAAGQSFRDHASVQTNALRYNQSNGVGFASSVAYDTNLYFTTANTILDGLQIKTTSANNTGVRQGATTAITIQNCIIQGLGTNLILCNANSTTVIVQNCLLLNTGTAGHGYHINGGAATLTGCTIFASGAHASGRGVWAEYSNGLVVKNTASAGYTTDYFGTAAAGCSNNATDQASFGGTNYGGSGQVSLVEADEWENVTTATADLRLKSTSAKLKDLGATTGLSVDIANSARPQGAAYDIGCWELVAAAASAISLGGLHHIENGMGDTGNARAPQTLHTIDRGIACRADNDVAARVAA